MKLSKSFSLEELVTSSTAKKLNIDNNPGTKELNNLIKLVTTVLQPIRDKYGKPIIISSGYRCPKLNKAVGGSATSQHKTGQAADIHSLSNTEKDNMILWNIICDMVKNGEIKTGQYIFEYGHKDVGPDWIHVSTPGNHLNQKLYIGAK